MTIIDMQRLRDALPKHAKIILRKKEIGGKTIVHIECYCCFPSLSEADFEMCKEWQRQIIGAENISEFYTETTGNHWIVYLKRVPMEFINTDDDDTRGYMGESIYAAVQDYLNRRNAETENQ